MAVTNSNSEADISACGSTRSRESRPTVSLCLPVFRSYPMRLPVFFLVSQWCFCKAWVISSVASEDAANAYVQDTFKATSRLTFNLGLRYDLPFPYTEIKNRQTLWVPGRQSTVVPDAPPGLLYPGDKGVPAGLIPTFKKAFAPRVGVAWDATGSGKLLVTAAYGIFYEPYYTGQGGPLQSPISAPPYLQTPQVSHADIFADPSLTGILLSAAISPRPLTNLTLAANLPLPYSQDWDLNIQRSFGSDLLFELGYVGTKGTKLPRFIEANPAIYIPGVDGSGDPISTSSNADRRRKYSGCTLDPTTVCDYSSTGLIVWHCRFLIQRS